MLSGKRSFGEKTSDDGDFLSPGHGLHLCSTPIVGFVKGTPGAVQCTTCARRYPAALPALPWGCLSSLSLFLCFSCSPRGQSWEETQGGN